MAGAQTPLRGGHRLVKGGLEARIVLDAIYPGSTRFIGVEELKAPLFCGID